MLGGGAPAPAPGPARPTRRGGVGAPAREDGDPAPCADSSPACFATVLLNLSLPGCSWSPRSSLCPRHRRQQPGSILLQAPSGDLEAAVAARCVIMKSVKAMHLNRRASGLYGGGPSQCQHMPLRASSNPVPHCVYCAAWWPSSSSLRVHIASPEDDWHNNVAFNLCRRCCPWTGGHKSG